MRRLLTLSLLILFMLCGLDVLIPGAQAWERRLLDNTGRAEAIALDPAGDVIAIGRVNGSEVAKLSGATGEVKWRFHPFHPEAPVSINKVAVDFNGDVVVVFVGTRTVVKISGSDGTEIWRKPIGGTANAFQDVITAVAIDIDGNVITAGSVGGLFNVCKLRGTDGTELWHHEQEGYAFAVDVDPFGDVAAAGLTNKNFGVIKLERDGQKLWQRELNGAGNFTDVFEQANAVAMDTDGSVIAVGNTSNSFANFRDFTVVKYAADGEQQWVYRIDGGWCEINDHGERVCQANDEGNAVALGKDGSVFAAGSLQTDGTTRIRGANEHFHVFKFSRDGNVVWEKAAEEAAPGEEYTRGRALTVSVDEAGDVVAAGQHNLRFTVVKFIGKGDKAGERAWLQQPGEPPTPGNPTTALDVATDDANNVVVSGELLGPDSFSNFTVVKLWGANGESYFGPAEPASPTYVPDTVLKYAPIVHLYSNDKYRPGDPATFINNSDLFWFHEGGCGQDQVVATPKIEPERLGTGDAAYFHNAILPRTSQDIPCVHSNKVFYASYYTRPYDGDKRSGPENGNWWDNPFYEREGFYLDPRDDDALRHGIPHPPNSLVHPGAPVFFEYVPRQYVTYWFFYPYDEFSFPDGVPLQFHEGDWERVSVQLDENEDPLHVFYYSHDDGMRVPWPEIERFETHPVVYSAKGSHASYPGPGSHLTSSGLPDRTNSGPEWHTWNDLLKVEAQPWFGFGGAWGQVGEPHFPVPGKDFTGPLGPSKYKTSQQTWVRSISGRVTMPDGGGLSSVKVTLADALGNTIYTVTNMTGVYAFQYVRIGREYTVSPSRDGYSFTPPSRTFSYLTENQPANFAVLDLLAPVLSLPADLTVNASTPLGAVVTYSVTATDNVTRSPRISCRPQSGDLFAIGITTVSCTAVDDANNSATGSFKVAVNGTAEQLTDLIFLIQQLNLKKSDVQKLVHNLEQAQKALSQGDKSKACRDIEQFIKEVMKESGKGLTPEQGKRLGDAARQIRAVIGCR
jgi:hypothetical protein